MKNLLTIIIFQLILLPISTNANENFSVEIEALTLVMEQYEKDTQKELKINHQKPSYMALKQDECNATVKVTQKTGLEIVGSESFDVNVCKKEINKVSTKEI